MAIAGMAAAGILSDGKRKEKNKGQQLRNHAG
jgi:hypothetical protein